MILYSLAVMAPHANW